MAKESTIKTYSAADIEKYHKGLLSPAEMHVMEKAALEDPFLADAMDGYGEVVTNIQDDLAGLRTRLQNHIDTGDIKKVIPMAPGNRFTWMKAAVLTGVLAGAGLLAYLFVFDKTEPDVTAQNPVKKAELRDPATPQTPVADKPDPGIVAAPADNKLKTTPAPVTNPVERKPVLESPDRISTPAPVTTTADAERKDLLQEQAGNAKPETLPDEAIAAKKEKAAEAGQSDSRKKALSRSNEKNAFTTNFFRGRVTDASNVGVPFARVINPEDNVGTYTDARGYFILTSPDSVLNVAVRSIGFENNQAQLRHNVPSNQVVLQDDQRSVNAYVISNQKPNTMARAQNNMKLEEPEPADGWENYDTYIANNLNIPEEYKNKPAADASVQLSFEVDKNGEPVNIRVEKSLCEKCDKEAIRLIKEGPKWKKNIRKGRTTVTIPFNQLF